jgi:hypothetical protein
MPVKIFERKMEMENSRRQQKSGFAIIAFCCLR